MRVALLVKQPLQRHAPFSAGRPLPTAAVGSSLPERRAHPARDGAAANAEVGRFFQEIKWALGVPTRELAQRLATRESVIKALEAGRIADLPEWPETVRVVSALASLARIDPRPVLHVIAGALAGGEVQAPHRGTRGKRMAAAAPVRAAGRGADGPGAERWHHRIRDGISRLMPQGAARADAPVPRRKPRLKTLLAVAAPAALWLFATETDALYRGLASVPASANRLVRPFQDYLLVALAPVREGHRWIEVDDPRSRRSGKLPTKRR